MTDDLDALVPHQGLFTVAEMATLLRVSERTIWRHVEKGALRPVRVGPFGSLRITRQELIRYADTDPGDSE